MLIPSFFLGLGFWSEVNVKTTIPVFFGMLLITLILRRLLKDRDDRIKNIPFAVIAAVLLVMEVWKQVWEFTHGYSLYAIPLHFCSVYLYLYPLAHWTKGKTASTFHSLSVGMTSMTFFLFYIYPMLIIGDSAQSFFTDFSSFHTVLYHNLLCLYFLLSIALEMRKPDIKRDLKTLFAGYGVYFLIAAPMANILDVNFNSFRFCGVEFIESIRLSVIQILGPVGGQLLYLVGVFAGTMVFGLLSFFAYYGLTRLVSTKRVKSSRLEQRTPVSEPAEA